MKVIQLTKGQVAIVDDEDFEQLAQYRWSCMKVGYAGRSIKIKGRSSKLFMHRVIMKPEKGMQVDHINGNKLDNRRENLRVCSQCGNIQNRGKNKNNTSGFKGVTFSKKENRWIAQIGANHKHIRVGAFRTPEEAALAYNAAALRLHGDFANIN